MEYVVSKLVTIAVISTGVGLLIGAGGGVIHNPLYFVAGVFLGSCLFSSVGLMVAANISSLNQFIVATIPRRAAYQHSRHSVDVWLETWDHAAASGRMHHRTMR